MIDDYIQSIGKIDDVVINLVGLRQDMELLPYPTVDFILTRAIDELKQAKSLYLKSQKGV